MLPSHITVAILIYYGRLPVQTHPLMFDHAAIDESFNARPPKLTAAHEHIDAGLTADRPRPFRAIGMLAEDEDLSGSNARHVIVVAPRLAVFKHIVSRAYSLPSSGTMSAAAGEDLATGGDAGAGDAAAYEDAAAGEEDVTAAE